MAVDSDGYTQEELKRIARKYLRECCPKDYRQMRRDGELEEHLEAQANRTRRVAENFMQTGTHASQAWSWAIRTEILEREID